jgi:hypothetical protein
VHHYNLKKSGLSITKFNTLMENIKGKFTADNIETFNEDALTSCLELNTICFYNISPLCEVTYQARDGKLAGHSKTGMRKILENVLGRKQPLGDSTFFIPVAEIRDRSPLSKNIGHYCTLVIEHKEGQWSMNVLDSKPSNSLLQYILKFFMILLGMPYSNSDIALSNMFSEVLKEGGEVLKKDISVNRHHYHHQQSIGDNLCGAFTLEFMKRQLTNAYNSVDFELDNEIKMVGAPNHLVSTADNFLKSEDIRNYETDINTSLRADFQADTVGVDMNDLDSDDDFTLC